MADKKILYYLNQFFGQIGGEEKAGIAPILKEGGVGPSEAFAKKIGDSAELVATVICGDNYFNENKEEAIAFLRKVNEEIKPDIVIAGPAFNAGRYGMACQGVAEFFAKEANIPVVSGMYEENPGLDEAKKLAYVAKTGDSAAKMRKALPIMADITKKLLNGEVVKPDVDNYFAQGKRLTVISEKTGSQRAVEMLMKRLNNEEFKTELPMPVFDTVEAAEEIKDLSKATIALVTTGGIVPMGNPDRIQSASAQKWGKYDISAIDELKGDYCTIHGGYDPVYANEDPDRVVPLDSLRLLEKEGKIGKVYDYFYTTTGTGTAIGNSIVFGKEMGQELKDAGVDGVILTST
ncbi:sarcosine reductase [Peptostreptococcus russellii]|uniref:Sarcosine reductase n=2 Tax=Peptostreptococcus russellii TaxID=215200 RepID=A0A2P7Q1V9_9FIRM|nr:sarcosine reductase [Peptostreptococcus russellii]